VILDFQFLELRDEDLPLVDAWFAAPHVTPWWGPAGESSAELRRHWRDGSIEPYRVDLEGRPFAFVQSYGDDPPPVAWPPQLAGTKGIDLLIGEVEQLGRGLGPALIRQFSQGLFTDHAVPRVIADPHRANGRSVRAFEKAGFRNDGTIDTPWGPAQMMVKERPAETRGHLPSPVIADKEEQSKGERPAMPDVSATARTTARILLEIEAVLFRPDDPFTFTSGRASPVYVDCRKIISFPRARGALMDMAVALIKEQAGYESLDAIAGGETAGIPFAAWIAERLGLPMLYVRKKPKGFGRDAQIEGALAEGSRVLLVEDLATDGGSKLNFVNALRTAGAEVAHTFVIFHYGIFPEGIAQLTGEGVKLHALATWWDVLAVAEEDGALGRDGIAQVRAFLEAPDSWSAAHGGKASAG
jgi:orotate phosphoribosyltransferase